MEKYGRAREATDDSIIQRMRTANRITKANIQTLMLFYDKNRFANAPKCYVLRTLRVKVNNAGRDTRIEFGTENKKEAKREGLGNGCAVQTGIQETRNTFCPLSLESGNAKHMLLDSTEIPSRIIT